MVYPVDFNGKMGMIGILSVPKDPKYDLAVEGFLRDYQWADTAFYEHFINYSGITSAKIGSTNLTISNGLHYYSGQGNTTENAKVFITNNYSHDNLTPGYLFGVKEPRAYSGNRGSNTIILDGTPIYNESISKTYVVRVSKSGISGTARCDVIYPDGNYQQQNTPIYQNSGIVIQDDNPGTSVVFKFTDAGPFYLHDSWAIRAVKGNIQFLSATVNYVGDPIISGLRLYIKEDGNFEGNLVSGINTIDIPSSRFGEVLEYGVDWTDAQAGNSLNIAMFLKKIDVNQSIIVHGLYIAMGDSEEYSHWTK